MHPIRPGLLWEREFPSAWPGCRLYGLHIRALLRFVVVDCVANRVDGATHRLDLCVGGGGGRARQHRRDGWATARWLRPMASCLLSVVSTTRMGGSGGMCIQSM
jgi:hypothetical protein